MLILETILLALATSLDSLVAAFGYGSSKIKVPFSSALVMSSINTVILGISVAIGYFLSGVISDTVSKWISFGLLLGIGIFKFFSELLKIWLNKRVQLEKAMSFKIFKFHLMLCVMADSQKADLDKNQRISLGEATLLGLVFSVDGIGVGLSNGVSNPYCYLFIIVSFFAVFGALFLGDFLGNKFAKIAKINLSWLSGLLLIMLGISKLFF